MAIRYSTGFGNALLKKASWRELLNECVLRIYTGTQPSSADIGATGTLLVMITRASGAFVAGTESTRQMDFVKVVGNGTASETHTITINGTNYTHTIIDGDTAATVAHALAKLVREDSNVHAIPTTLTTEVGLAVEARLAGESYSIEVATTASVASVVVSNIQANSRYNGLHWGSVNARVITKESAYAWSGSGIVGGTAGWFRMSENSDIPTNTSTTAIRMDGSVGTSGANLILGSTTIVANGTVTIDEASFTLPAS